AIAAVHAEAKTADETDWPQIVALYKELMGINPSPIVALNHAAAVAMSEGVEKGLTLVEEAGAGRKLDQYYLFHAARADLLRRLNRLPEAATAYARALTDDKSSRAAVRPPAPERGYNNSLTTLIYCPNCYCISGLREATDPAEPER